MDVPFRANQVLLLASNRQPSPPSSIPPPVVLDAEGERGGQDGRETVTYATGPPPVARSEVSLSISSGALPPPPFAWRRAGSGPLGVDPDADRRPRLAGDRGDG